LAGAVQLHDVQILDAAESDLEGLLGIYNDVIATSTAIYSHLPVTLDDRRQWWRARVAQQYPVLVARDPSGVLGFASFDDFRAWPGYRSRSSTRCTYAPMPAVAASARGC